MFKFSSDVTRRGFWAKRKKILTMNSGSASRLSGQIDVPCPMSDLSTVEEELEP